MTVQTAFDTLFLDRDGVINVLRPHDYVKSWDEFEFTDGAIEALRMLSPLFRHIVVVTNQRGVGKGVMTEEALRTIHRRMIEAVAAGGGRIDAVYYCADRNEDSPNRKPNTGMALQARRDFPDIDFSKTILVGDSGSDMEFGRRIGARTVLIHPDDPCTIFRCGTAKNTVLEFKKRETARIIPQPNLSCGRITEKQIFRTSKNIVDPDLMRTFVP